MYMVVCCACPFNCCILTYRVHDVKLKVTVLLHPETSCQATVDGFPIFFCVYKAPAPTPAAALLVFSTFFTRASVCMFAKVRVVGPAQHLDKWSKMQTGLARIQRGSSTDLARFLSVHEATKRL